MVGSESRRDPALGLLLVASIVTGFYLGAANYPLFDVDEGAFSEATREMLEGRDFIIPTLHGEPRYDKPILIYWLQAASIGILGPSEAALRAPSVTAATAWAVVLFLFVRHVLDWRKAALSAAILASTFSVTVVGKAATADALLNLFLTGSLFAAYLHFRHPDRLWLVTAFVLSGLGFLTKGPVAVVVPAMVTLLLYASERRLAEWLRTMLNPLGVALFLILTVPWYAAAYVQGDGALYDQFFLKHNVERFQSPMHGHAGSLTYYVPVLLLITLPYTGLIAAAARLAWAERNDPLARYAAFWIGLVFAFFSLSGTKLPHYLNYGLVGLVILFGWSLDRGLLRRWMYLPPVAALGFLLLLPFLLPELAAQVDDPYYRSVLGDPRGAFSDGYIPYLGAACALVLALMASRFHRDPRSLITVGIAFNIAIAGFVLPAVAALKQEPIQQVAALVKERDLDGVVMWRMNNPSLSFYADREIPKGQPSPGGWVITRAHALSELGDHHEAFRARGIVLVKVGR